MRLLRLGGGRNDHQERERCAVQPVHGRLLHSGVGKRGLSAASSSGETIAFLPSCHWIMSALWPTWNPPSSTRKGPNTVFISSFSSAARTFSLSSEPARRIDSCSNSQ